MTVTTQDFKDLGGFYRYWFWYWMKASAKDTWRSLPGPWWCKLAIIALCLAIPGEIDEVLLLVVLRYFRLRRQRRIEQGLIPGDRKARD